MRLSCAVRALLLVIVVIVLPARAMCAQSSQSVSPASVPRLIKIAGVFHPADGQPAGTVESVTFSIYADPDGGVPLWQETQTIMLDEQGRYTVLLGATQESGIPAAVFASGDAQWLGTMFERPGEMEGPRVRIASVPYAFKAQDAETLGGRSASDYMLTPTAKDHEHRTADAAKPDLSSSATANLVVPGTPNSLAKYVNSTDLGSSAVYATGSGAVGIGTSAPADWLHVRFTNTGGTATGLAVQNMGNTAASYSGMLFFDQLGQLAQFQGFNNSTHEYRINNIAQVSPGGAYNGSINFMIGSTSRLFVGSNGGIGIGTTSAGPGLEVSNSLTGALVGTIAASTYGINPFGGTFVARKARGTQAAPAAVQNGDQIALFAGVGMATTHSGNLGNGMEIRAAENYTDAAQGTALTFLTTKRGTNTPIASMTLDHSGSLGLGTNAPSAPLEVSRTGTNAGIVSTLYVNGADAGSFLVAQTARGTAAAPTAIQVGDFLGALLINGFGTTGFDEAAAVGALAAENFSDAARGTVLAFATTPLGGNDSVIDMALLPSGNLSIGTPLDVNGLPTATDRLQVFGDVRLGTTGTNGCVKNFAGTGLIGTCSSDRRLKKDITPFGLMLDKVTALQPVHYFWRTSEFPDRHFGNTQNYGLIAQDVEQVLPELVATDSDGYKAVDYSKLPLLTIQAVKDLKSENDALKQRVSELERLVSELLAATPRPMTRR